VLPTTKENVEQSKQVEALEKDTEDLEQKANHLFSRYKYEVLTGSITLHEHIGAAEIDSSGGAVTGTLGSGYFIGQIKTIVMTEASNLSTISITNHQTSDPEVATFDAVDEVGVFMWTGTEWITIFATCTFV
jgi:hypothetical protein